jgi:Raf kinase inhibitor-like YbhB/YbcL family protein
MESLQESSPPGRAARWTWNRRFLGRLLKRVRAGEKHLAWNDAGSVALTKTIVLSSSAFTAGGIIPPRYGGEGVGENVSPALSWSGVPTDAKEIVLIVEDADAPLPRPFVHVIVFAIPALATALAEGRLSSPAGAELVIGKNTLGKAKYGGPRPVPGHGPHRYVFQIFAIDRHLAFASPPSRRQILLGMEGAVVARGRLDGFYER